MEASKHISGNSWQVHPSIQPLSVIPGVKLLDFFFGGGGRSQLFHLLVGGWTTHMKNMLVKLEIFPK